MYGWMVAVNSPCKEFWQHQEQIYLVMAHFLGEDPHPFNDPVTMEVAVDP